MKQTLCSLVAATTLVILPSLVSAKTDAAAGSSGLDLARRLESAFVQVAEEASASVVVITTTQKASAQMQPEPDEEALPEDLPFKFFFRRRGAPQPQERDVDSQGSGVVMRKDGYILTNNHVIRNATEIKVRLKDGRELPATVVGSDDRTDIAVIKVDAKDLPAAKLANSEEVRVGQWAIAIGAPYQLDYSFTVGFVSAKGRSAVWNRGGSAYEDYIQTDASINPGNSGGPLCDIEGRVIGINKLIRGINRGIGFAIPINMARDVADQLIDKGKITRPWLGIQIEALSDNQDLANSVKDLKDGVVVRAIYPATPAAQSDLKPADIIVAVDGVDVKNPRDLQRQVLRKKIGEQVALSVIRDGKPVQVALQTGELPEEPQVASQRTPREKAQTETTWGLTVQTLTKDLASRFNLTDTEGVLVTDVAAESLAQQKGLQAGDVITEVNRQSVRTAEEFAAVMAKVEPQKGALLYVKREGASTFVVLKETK